LRNFVALCALASLLVYLILSQEALLERVQGGFDRVSQGVEVLERREDVAGHTSFGDRTDWKNEGIKGWMRSPLFGNGVEAFRADVGITSHSTPIDLLYNTGVIGLAAFYAIFALVLLHLWQVRGVDLGSLPPLIFAGLVCYSFISLSSNMHYSAFLAIFFAISTGLLRQAIAARTPTRPPPQRSREINDSPRS
jgi:hypothetical protein